MTKRRLEREVEKLSDEVLGRLSAVDRIALFVEAMVAGDEHRLERLTDTCPRRHVWHTDLQFVAGAQLAKDFAILAVYDLHTTVLAYYYLRDRQQQSWRLDFERDDDPSEEYLDKAAERADEMRILFAKLDSTYHANRRFAETVLGLELRTWLALHPDGAFVLDIVEQCLADSSWASPMPEWFDEELATRFEERYDVEPPDKAELAAERFEGILTAWNDGLAMGDSTGVL